MATEDRCPPAHDVPWNVWDKIRPTRRATVRARSWYAALRLGAVELGVDVWRVDAVEEALDITPKANGEAKIVCDDAYGRVA